MTTSPDYRVALDVYSGPMDLLLYLIRRDEIDIYDIPIARITEQYVAYVAMLGEIDPEIVSEFLVLAATLMEIKSRTLLPRPPVKEGEEDVSDPRLELVQQLLAYKKFKDAARSLEDAAEVRSQRHARSPVLPSAPDEMELDNLDIWTLYEAFRKLLEQIGRGGGVHKVGVDDTPVALHAEDILDSIERAGGSQAFEQVFAGRTRPEMIGLFLALLELIRQRRVRVMQDRPFGTILVTMLDRRPLDAVPDDTADRGATGPFGASSQAMSQREAEAEPIAHSITESDQFEEESEESDLTLISSVERDRGDVEWPAKAIDGSERGAAEESESSSMPDSLRGIPHETE